MMSYTPLAGRMTTVTFTAAARITAGDPLEAAPGEVMRVRRPTVAVPSYVGIAGHDAVLGDDLTVHVGSGTVHIGACTGTVAAGDLLIAAWQPGRQVFPAPAPAPNDSAVTREIIGVALSGAADGGTVRWLSTR